MAFFMQMYTDLLQLEDELDGFVYDFGYQVVDLIHAGGRTTRTFRLFIERVSGDPVSIDDCGQLARQVILFLEMKGVYNDKTSLEVSSAGLDRVLKRDRDFERYLGSEVKVTWRDGTVKKSIIGELASFTDEILAIATADDISKAGTKQVRAAKGVAAPVELTTISVERGSLERVSLVPKVEF